MLIQSIGENKPEQWFASGFGHWVMAQERRYCRRMLGEAFGLYALQLGHCRRSLTRAAPVHNHAIVGSDDGCQVFADWTALPFATETVDCVLLAHALEAAATPHAVLRETVRVLRPQGRLLIVGFNPWSLLGARLAVIPWRERWLSLQRVKDWLALLEMSVVEGQFAVFMPPHRWRARRRLGWLEKAGRRWWPLGGGVYFLHAIKRPPAIHPVGRLNYRMPLLNAAGR